MSKRQDQRFPRTLSKQELERLTIKVQGKNADVYYPLWQAFQVAKIRRDSENHSSESCDVYNKALAELKVVENKMSAELDKLIEEARHTQAPRRRIARRRRTT